MQQTTTVSWGRALTIKYWISNKFAVMSDMLFSNRRLLYLLERREVCKSAEREVPPNVSDSETAIQGKIVELCLLSFGVFALQLSFLACSPFKVLRHTLSLQAPSVSEKYQKHKYKQSSLHDNNCPFMQLHLPFFRGFV